MAAKTKNDLLEEIEQKNEEIEALKADINRLEKYQKYDEAASEIKAMNDSFVRAGFTEEQAFQMVSGMVTANAGKPTLF